MKAGNVIYGLIMLIIGAGLGVYVLGDTGGDRVAATVEGDAAPEAVAAIGPTVHWKMASAFASELVQLGDQGKMIEKRIAELTSGTVELKFFEPGALVPALEIFDAVSTGAVDAGWSAAGYWAGKVPALQFFTAVPFGPNVGEAVAWLYHGGGEELLRELYAPYNIQPFQCNLISPEGSGWFRDPIETLDDFKGLKMRFFGSPAATSSRRSSLAPSTPPSSRCRPSISTSASTRLPSTTTSPAGTSRRACSS